MLGKYRAGSNCRFFPDWRVDSGRLNIINTLMYYNCFYFFAANIESSVQLRSPVTFCYEPHQGPVHSVEWSPYHRNLFISSSMDGCVRIYSLLQVRLPLTLIVVPLP